MFMKLIVNNNIFKVKLSFTPKNIEKGMMGQKFNDDFNGMLFLMNNKDIQCFWMYNCIIPLDIIMIKDNIITKIHHNCPPCDNKDECKSYCGQGDKVLELLGGTCKELDIKKGDKITFSSF